MFYLFLVLINEFLTSRRTACVGGCVISKKAKAHIASSFVNLLTQRRNFLFAVSPSPSEIRKVHDLCAGFSPIVSFYVQLCLVFSVFGAINIFAIFSQFCVVRQMFYFIYYSLQLCIELQCLEMQCFAMITKKSMFFKPNFLGRNFLFLLGGKFQKKNFLFFLKSIYVIL